MSTKLSSRPRKQRPKDDMKHEIVVQVHKTIKKEQGADKENINKTESGESSSRSGSNSNRTFLVEDKNDNYSIHTPSRDISVDEETQINSKILNLIETEMKREVNKHSHFTDSRPQSLSFYEDEKIPEELSGNLELLSPEERRHYRRRKEYIDIDMERNNYNNLQDTLSRENDDIVINGPNKKSKSRKKKHSGDPELGLGDSREMMIPKEKRKSKKKKRESSPMSSNSGKRKHRKRDDEFEPKNDIALALDELQDDVFENGPDEFVRSERVRRSPRKSDKLYVQRKNKFELTRSGDQNSGMANVPANSDEELFSHPIHIACCVQKCCSPVTLLAHGFLGGLALFHYIYLCTESYPNPSEFTITDEEPNMPFIDVFACLFYVLIVLCIISVFDRYDLSHLDVRHLNDLLEYKKSVFVVLIYACCFICHLVAARTDDKLGLINYNSANNITSLNVTVTGMELQQWMSTSLWRAIFAILGWCCLAFTTHEDLFYIHLKNMIQYATNN